MNAPFKSSPPRELKLGADLKQLINTALERGRMLAVAYVSGDGRPEISFRGSLQAFSDTQLALWVRNPEGGILKAVKEGHTHISALYGEVGAQARVFLTFRGQAHVDNSKTVRETVYASIPPIERDRDKQQQGVPLIIDLDSVEGLYQGEFMQMRR